MAWETGGRFPTGKPGRGPRSYGLERGTPPGAGHPPFQGARPGPILSSAPRPKLALGQVSKSRWQRTISLPA